jgi:hypothetical protein
MPWEIRQGTSQCSGYGVFKEGTSQLEGCHSTREAANKQVAALYASEKDIDKKSPCWDGYVQRGTKPGKDGRQVPNCVPAKKSIWQNTPFKVFDKNNNSI